MPSAATLSGQIRLDQGKIDLALLMPAADLALGEYFGQIPLQGTGRVETRITGPFDHINVAAKFKTKETSVMRIPLGQVDGEAVYQDRLIKWHNVVARPEDGGLLATESGSLDMNKEEYPLTAKIDVHDVSREVVREIATVFMPDADFAADLKKLTGTYQGSAVLSSWWWGEVELRLGRSPIQRRDFDDQRGKAI